MLLRQTQLGDWQWQQIREGLKLNLKNQVSTAASKAISWLSGVPKTVPTMVVLWRDDGVVPSWGVLSQGSTGRKKKLLYSVIFATQDKPVFQEKQ